MRRPRPRAHLSAEVNVTSLLDTVFVLLIAFMIVAPAVKHGAGLELPKVKEAKSLKEAPKAISVQVRWDEAKKEPRIQVDGNKVEMERVVKTVQDKQLASSDSPVTLEADRRVPWNVMADLITRLRSAGVGSLGIVTEKASQS